MQLNSPVNPETLLTTDRLLLRTWTLADAPFILDLLNTDGWLRFIGDRNIRTLEDAENYLKTVLIKGFETNGFGFWCMQDRESGLPVGMAGFVQREWLPGIDLGFALHPDYTGKGYAFEACEALMKKVNGRQGFETIFAITNRDNERSMLLLKRLGFRFLETILPPNEPETLNLFECKAP